MGNFSRAAAELGYGQSTVTTQIQALERELKVALFERNGKKAALSAAGEEFREYAYEMVKCEEMALEHFSNEKEPAGHIKIGVMETICASRYGEIFKQFLKKYPKVRLTTVVATTLECMDMLEKGTLDVILTVDKIINRPYWERAHMLDTEICFFCSSSHPFASGEPVTLDQLYGSVLSRSKKAAITERHLNSILASQGKSVDEYPGSGIYPDDH